jgi:hypothetical protein
MGVTEPLQLEDIKRLALQPGDVLVVRLPVIPSPEMVDSVRLQLEAALPGHKVFVLAPGIDLEVISG